MWRRLVPYQAVRVDTIDLWCVVFPFQVHLIWAESGTSVYPACHCVRTKYHYSYGRALCTIYSAFIHHLTTAPVCRPVACASYRTLYKRSASDSLSLRTVYILQYLKAIPFYHGYEARGRSQAVIPLARYNNFPCDPLVQSKIIYYT